MTMITLLSAGTTSCSLLKPYRKMARMLSADPFKITTSALYGPRDRFTSDCKICIKMNVNIKHRHHSTMYAREKLLTADQPTMDCVTCKVRHNRDIQGDRHKVIVCSSTLHDAWLEPSVRNLFHVDLISICGGTMKQGRMDCTRTYNLQNKALDIVAVFGLNDVKRVEASAFKAEMVRWKYAVEAHGMTYGVQNTLGFVKMPHAPSVAWLAGDGPLPTVNHRNLLHKVDTFNRLMDEMNGATLQSVVSFENEGQRTTRQGVQQHVWRSWRESEREDMLHLTDFHRAKMYNRIIKYLQFNTTMCPQDFNA